MGNGIYKDVDATYPEIVDATRKLEHMYRSHGDEPVFDSIDRERVRDFILDARKAARYCVRGQPVRWMCIVRRRR